jgi:hypothetical protein
MVKPLRDIWSITIGEAFYRLICKVLCFQFDEVFFSHLSLHQFGMTIKSGCEVVVYSIQVVLNIHSDWVVL